MDDIRQDKRTASKPRRHSEAHVAQAANDLLNESKKMANDLYEQGRTKLQEAGGHVKERSDELVHKITEKPLTALLIAGGIGFLLAAIFRR